MKIKKLVQTATEKLGLTKLRRFQIDPINNILDHRDTLVIAPTSAGKSAIYQIPAVINSKKGQWTLVIEPTLALIADQVHRLHSLSLAAEMITGRNFDEHDNILCKLRVGEIAILYVTPERLQTSAFQSVVKDNPPWLLVVDEAHCVLDWGFTFRSAYLKIKSFIKDLEQHPVIATFTATAPPEYQTAICKQLGIKKANTYALSLTQNNIILLKEDYSNLGMDKPKKDRSDLIMKKRLSRVKYNIKKYGGDGRVVVYCATRKNVDIVYNYLSKKFKKEVVKCHAYMDSDKRENTNYSSSTVLNAS